MASITLPCSKDIDIGVCGHSHTILYKHFTIYSLADTSYFFKTKNIFLSFHININVTQFGNLGPLLFEFLTENKFNQIKRSIIYLTFCLCEVKKKNSISACLTIEFSRNKLFFFTPFPVKSK